MKSKSPGAPGRYRNRRGDLYEPGCPSRAVLDHVTSRWGSLVLILLLQRPHRFSELARGIGGVSEKMLAQSLQVLVADGFILRTVYPTVPPQVDYRLTAMGVEVAERMQALASWVEDHLGEVSKFRQQHSAKREPAR